MPSCKQEQLLWAKGFLHIAGVDEAGRGPWAGPVVAGAVILPTRCDETVLQGLTDSKLLSEKQRDRWFEVIKRLALAVGTGLASAREIDQLGIVPATKKAMLTAIARLETPAQYLLIDALKFQETDLDLLAQETREQLKPLMRAQVYFIKGELMSYSIAAASIIAKVSRDRIMAELDRRYPRYGFARHKGYGTKEHQKALLTYGPCPEHRASFRPIKQLLDIGL
ncbi:MAG TPA: ribonuclease HII [bacterium]|nr:ribonuclease HII [bacterium]